jgi:bifunctional non-homologous end joining protein LigD
MANDDIKVFTRRGNDWTKRFRKVAADAYLINAKSAIIDGEIVVPAADGTTDFSVLQNELKGKSDKIVMVAFDLLYLNGQDIRKLPLLERKTILQKLIAKTAIQFSDSFEIDGREMFKHACKAGLEVVVSKVRDSRYPTDRTNDWVKVTCAQRETLRIAGFALDGSKWDGLYIGRERAGQLIYAGKVDHGFTPEFEKELRARLKPLIAKSSPTQRRSRTAAYGLSRRCLLKSSTGPSRPRARCGTRFSKASGRICDEGDHRVQVVPAKEAIAG